MSADSRIKTGQYHETYATRVIEPGEEIFLSYYLCKQCGGRRHKYGAGGMLQQQNVD